MKTCKACKKELTVNRAKLGSGRGLFCSYCWDNIETPRMYEERRKIELLALSDERYAIKKSRSFHFNGKPLNEAL